MAKVQNNMEIAAETGAATKAARVAAAEGTAPKGYSRIKTTEMAR